MAVVSSASSPPLPPRVAALLDAILDPRTEWSFRWTILTLLSYSLLFYAPRTIAPYVDWTLPIQLVQGGNLGFYNAGWHYWFGLMAALGLVVGGMLCSVIFGLLQNDNIVGGYVVLMTLLTILVSPCAAYLGVLSDLSGLAVLLVVIFTENIYVPVLDLRNVLPDVASIWSEVILGSVVAALVYIGLSWMVYAVPPWHSGTTQALRLAGGTAGGIADTLRAAAKAIRSYDDPHYDKDLDENSSVAVAKSRKERIQVEMQGLGSSLFQGTNYAGLQVPINLYASMGMYELSPVYPLTSLDLRTVKTLSQRLDGASYHCSVLLSILGHTNALKCCLGEDESSLALRDALAAHLEASAELSNAAAVMLQVERRQRFGEQDAPNDASSCNTVRETLYLNQSLWEWNGPNAVNSQTSMQAYNRAVVNGDNAANALKVAIDSCCSLSSSMGAYAKLLWTTMRDTSYGDRLLIHFNQLEDVHKSQYHGTLGRLSGASVDLQRSWTERLALLRQMKRMALIEQLEKLAKAWFAGVQASIKHIIRINDGDRAFLSILERRGFRRAVQWTVGTWSLYAMATWWEEFRTMWGSSSNGPWTMVAFYVCFRPTVEETVNTAILRSIGHGLGALLSWAVNANVSSYGLLMLIHGIITLVFTWLIPTPFTYPSKLSFPWDVVFGTGLIEGLLTTYHLTSSIVLTTDPASAAKARATSQCIGSLFAAVVSVFILPWWAESHSEQMLEEFRKLVTRIMAGGLQKRNLGRSISTAKTAVDELLTCQRDLSSVSESKWLGGILRSFGLLHPSETDALRQRMIAASIGGVALEAAMLHIDELDTVLPLQVTDAIKAGDGSRISAALLDSISSASEKGEDDILATCYVAFVIMEKTGLVNKSKEEDGQV